MPVRKPGVAVVQSTHKVGSKWDRLEKGVDLRLKKDLHQSLSW